MSQQNLQFSKASDFKILDRLRLGSTSTKTLAGTLTMVATDPIVQFLDPGGAGRTILLPPEEDGLVFVFVNKADAAEVLTIKDDANAVTFATPTQAEAAILFCNGVTWGGLVGASS